ncbi:AAA family ATPase [Patescibacteria group bacterium]|nr:AAA family ATPase [Patescibacteria group bacterium]
MNVSRITLNRFKKFDTLDVAFTSGLNVIKGKNEQGKSTLVSAIIAGLFYDPKKNNKDIRSHKSWGEEKLYDIALEFDSDDASYVLKKDFENKTVLIRNVGSGKEHDAFKDAKSCVAEASGLSTPTLFESTACVRQDKMAALSSGKKELEAVLQDIITSGTDSVSAVDVLKRLQKMVKDLKKGLDRPTKYPGKLKEISDELAEKQEEHVRLKGLLQDIHTKKDEQQGLSQTKETLEKEFAIKRELFKENAELQDVLKEYESVKKELTRAQILIDSAEKVTKDIHSAKEKRTLFSGFDSKDLRADEATLLGLEAKKKSLEEKQNDQKEVKPRNTQMILYVISVVVFLMGFLGLLIHPAFYGFFVLGAMGALYTFYSQKNTLVEDTIFEKEKSIQDESKKILSRYSCADFEEFSVKKGKYEALIQEINTHKAKLGGVLSGESLEDLAKKKTDFATKLALLEATKKQIGSDKLLSPEAFKKLEYEVAALEKELREVDTSLTRANTLIEASGDEEKRLLELDESIASLRDELAHEKTRLAVYEETFRGIYEAKTIVSKSAKTVLEEDMKHFLPRLTNGKYTDVSVDDDLVFTVKNEVSDMVRPEEHLSRGTIDQFYLVARFSLIKLMSEDKKPLIILDDPLVTFDEDRTKQAMELIKEFSKEYQIFLFTYADEYDAWAENVVEL